jgi:3-hydroxyisobutyrate dehydrogenase-like beta-hydroxyacid dehydrogenase
MERIGFVGLGTIGGAIAKNILKSGYPMLSTTSDLRRFND